MQILSNLAMVLRAWKNTMLVKYPSLNVVYSHSMTYQDDVVEMRGEHVMNTETESTYNLFAFSRESLIWATTHRAAKIDPKDYSGSHMKLYKAWYSSIPINFVFYAPNPKYIEEFEIKYHVEDGITGIDGFTLDLQQTLGLGQWEYQCIWATQLKTLDIKYNDVYYKGLGGSLIINGANLLFDQEVERIESIDYTIFDYTDLTVDRTNPVLHNEVIVP